MTTSGAVEQSFDERVTTCKHNTTHIPADVSHYSTNRHLVAVTCKNTLIYTSKKKEAPDCSNMEITSTHSGHSYTGSHVTTCGGSASSSLQYLLHSVVHERKRTTGTLTYMDGERMHVGSG